MSSLDAFYEERLYPLQDGVLRSVSELGTPLYLTGGTALSRGYFGHRYSDALDLFVNADPRYVEWVEMVFETLERAEARGELTLLSDSTIRAESFVRASVVSLKDPELELKIDLVNDSAPHFGRLSSKSPLGALDGVRNILSNKIAATLRFEAKDFADLWAICRNRSFRWDAVWPEARAKELGLDPGVVGEIVGQVPLAELQAVRWRSIPIEEVQRDLSAMAFDIVSGLPNSLGNGKPALDG